MPGTYNIVVSAVDEYGAETVATTTATAYPPISAVGGTVLMPDHSDYSRYDTGGFYLELNECGTMTCSYYTGYVLDHYGMASSATVVGNSVISKDTLGRTHSGSISGSDYNSIKGYVGSILSSH